MATYSSLLLELFFFLTAFRALCPRLPVLCEVFIFPRVSGRVLRLTASGGAIARSIVQSTMVSRYKPRFYVICFCFCSVKAAVGEVVGIFRSIWVLRRS